MSDQARFLELFLANEADLKAFLRSLVRNRTDFDDVYQTVALRLLEKFDRYDAERPFGAWARGVAANEVLAMRRKARRQPLPFDPEIVTQITDAFERRVARRKNDKAERNKALEKCLDVLPEESRALLELRYEQSLPISEVAERAGRTNSATQRALSRIRRQLGDCIEQRLAATEGDNP